MITDDKILYFLNYLKENEGSTGSHLLAVIENHFSKERNEAGIFLNYIDKKKNYIYHTEDKGKYYLTDEGKYFIKKEERKKKNKKWFKILLVILPIIFGLLVKNIYDEYNKPDINLLYNGKDLMYSPLIVVDYKDYPQQIQCLVELQLLNVGSKGADNVKSYLYLNQGWIESSFSADDYYFNNKNEVKSEEKDFKNKYKSNPYLDNLSLNPKEPYYIDFLYGNDNITDTEGMIKIFYGQPEPTIYYFTIKLRNRKD